MSSPNEIKQNTVSKNLVVDRSFLVVGINRFEPFVKIV